jgi:O-antigen ligase
MNPPGAATSGAKRTALCALLALLPAFVCVLPGGPLSSDPFPADSGAGLVVLASAPALLLSLFLPAARVSWSPAFLAALLVAALNLAREDSLDGAAAQRAWLAWLALACALWIGARLAARKDALLVGLVALALLAAAPALFERDGGFAGALGNAASTSEAALCGALAGAALWALRDHSAPGREGVGRAIPWLGLAAYLALLVHAVLAPVLSTCVAALAALALLALCSRGKARWRAAGLALAALVAFAAAFSTRGTPAPAANELSSAAARDVFAGGPAAGVPVRLQVARAGFDLLAEDPWAGVGTGQWMARFPAVRDIEEIERSTQGRRLAEDTEVEHPHDDWLLPLYEGGLLGGLPWIAFLAAGCWCAARRLRVAAAEPTGLESAACATAFLAVALEGAARSPWFHNPAAAAPSFLALGVVLSAPGASRGLAARATPALLCVLVLASAQGALGFVRQGAALSSIAREGVEPDETRAALQTALEARPDSAIARTLEARRLRGAGAPPDVQERAWLAVLEPRPHAIEALLRLGELRIAARDPAGARARYEAVLALDARHPVAARNLHALCVYAGDARCADDAWARLEGRRPDAAWLATLAARAALRGVPESARHEWARLGPPWSELGADSALELSKAGVGDIKKGLEAYAHARYADDHAAIGAWTLCLRSLRQYLRACRAFEDDLDPRVELRVAAALCRAGEVGAAKESLGGRVATREELAALPEWARVALSEEGLAGP